MYLKLFTSGIARMEKVAGHRRGTEFAEAHRASRGTLWTPPACDN